MDKIDLSAFKDTLTNAGEIITFVVAGILAVLSGKIKDKWKSRKAKKFERSLKHNVKIKELLSEIRAIYESDRVKLFQFHNGDYFLSGESSMKCTLTHYVLKIGVNVPTENPSSLQSIPTSHLVHFLDDIKQGSTYIIYSGEPNNILDPFLEYIFSVSGTTTALAVPVRDVRGFLIGFVMVTWLDEHELGFRPSETQLIEYANKIGALMTKTF